MSFPLQCEQATSCCISTRIEGIHTLSGVCGCTQLDDTLVVNTKFREMLFMPQGSSRFTGDVAPCPYSRLGNSQSANGGQWCMSDNLSIAGMVLPVFIITVSHRMLSSHFPPLSNIQMMLLRVYPTVSHRHLSSHFPPLSNIQMMLLKVYPNIYVHVWKLVALGPLGVYDGLVQWVVGK